MIAALGRLPNAVLLTAGEWGGRHSWWWAGGNAVSADVYGWSPDARAAGPVDSGKAAREPGGGAATGAESLTRQYTRRLRAFGSGAASGLAAVAPRPPRPPGPVALRRVAAPASSDQPSSRSSAFQSISSLKGDQRATLLRRTQGGATRHRRGRREERGWDARPARAMPRPAGQRDRARDAWMRARRRHSRPEGRGGIRAPLPPGRAGAYRA